MKDNINTFISVNWLKVAPAPIQPILKLSLVNKVVPIMKVWSVLKETSNLVSGKTIDATYGFAHAKNQKSIFNPEFLEFLGNIDIIFNVI